MSDANMVGQPGLVVYWCGKRVDEMERQELVAAMYEIAPALEAEREARLASSLALIKVYRLRSARP